MEYLTGLELLLNWFNDVVFPRLGMSFPSFFINPWGSREPKEGCEDAQGAGAEDLQGLF